MSDNSRSYGYIGQNGPNKPQKPPKKPKIRQNTHNFAEKSLESPKKQRSWLGILLFLISLPFRLIAWIFRLFFRGYKKKDKEGRREIRRRLFTGIIGLGALGFLMLVIFGLWVSRDLPDPNKLTEREIAQSTKIYDRTGEHLLYEIFSEQRRTLVELDEIPQDLIHGLVATEDTAFYEHKGIRPLSIARSIVYGILGRGRVGGGASTLTQQLVKNAILTNERTITRKLKEFILAVRLEQKYTKDQILQIYFNEIPYGSTNYGVESAAQSYFGKSVADLSLAESATLAGIPKQPTRYLNDPELLKERRNFVLRRMHEEGFITEQEKNDAQSQDLELKQKLDNIQAPHFVLYVKEQLVNEFGESLVETGGLEVITTLDYDKQEAAEIAVKEESEKTFEEAGADNTALVAMDPKTGQILAMVGSRDYFDSEISGQFNVATLGRRQPGSSFKPIIYTAAFEKGYTPGTVLYDVVTNFGAASGQKYQPLNYDLKEHGPVTMQKALQGSLNIPAVKTMYLVGAKESTEFAERLGYSTLSHGDYGLSLVLGGGEVRLIDHVAAYSVFASGGLKTPPVSVLRVEDPSGQVLKEWKEEKRERVIEKETADTISNVLSNDGARAYAFGSGGILTLPGRPVAAKTGTTNSYVDAWTIGYTPQLVAGVWAGNTDNTAMNRGFGGSRVAAPIWNRFMKEALKDAPVENFPQMPEVKTDKAALLGTDSGGITVKINKVTGKRAASSTPENLVVERSYVRRHSILHYVDKNDPRGPAPEVPSLDPQYSVWEAAIEDWIKRKREEDPNWEISFEEPPEEFDNEYSLELIPEMNVVFPSPSSTLFSRHLQTDIRVSAPRGVKQVGYELDGIFLGYVSSHPFNLSRELQGVEPGNHTLKIYVEDDIGNRLEQEIPFTLSVPPEPPSVYFEENAFTVSRKAFPRVLYLRHYKLDELQKVEIIGEKDGEETIFGEITNFDTLFGGRILFSWSGGPDLGTWELKARVTTKANFVHDSDTVRATVTE
ncbi:PBP1A family penicillin-binding protein [Candidatus Nomurabacteria bacterium]|nr:PBP1A family penicillin-binding protein [Candidatus Nomurabacteria bacterium]